LEGDLEGLQEWRVGEGVWRSMQNGSVFRDPTGVKFYTKPLNFGVEARTEAPTLTQSINRASEHDGWWSNCLLFGLI
jgi:hypothetical protein